MYMYRYMAFGVYKPWIYPHPRVVTACLQAANVLLMHHRRARTSCAGRGHRSRYVFYGRKETRQRVQKFRTARPASECKNAIGYAFVPVRPSTSVQRYNEPCYRQNGTRRHGGLFSSIQSIFFERVHSVGERTSNPRQMPLTRLMVLYSITTLSSKRPTPSHRKPSICRDDSAAGAIPRTRGEPKQEAQRSSQRACPKYGIAFWSFESDAQIL
ncbi:hypothetical protein DFH11DRAFT_553211 [Phellopilus nigrolimitatus]|nr:hypothetical protein DFH11DRAFT_553211 [Phellopilus nigrolimitatus]